MLLLQREHTESNKNNSSQTVTAEKALVKEERTTFVPLQ